MKQFLMILLLWSIFNIDAQPRVSIITSVYNGDSYIKNFLENIVQQTVFDQCELLLINANSPGNEEPIIREFMEKHPNIVYIKLDADPGVYGVWNLGAMVAQGEYLTNANLDDLRSPDSIEICMQELDAHPEIMLVYANYLITRHEHDTWEHNHAQFYVAAGEFKKERMNLCLPGPQPMWRKTLHDLCGYFDASYISSGDWELWNRAAQAGAQFKHIDRICGIYYENPQGLSTDQNPQKKARRDRENEQVIAKYRDMWGW